MAHIKFSPATQSIATPATGERASDRFADLTREQVLLKELLAVEEFSARRNVLTSKLTATMKETQKLEEEAKEEEFWNKLGQRVTLPIETTAVLPPQFLVNRHGLYLGGVDLEKSFRYSTESSIWHSLYIGPMPPEAVAKFKEASQCKHSQAIVVSTIKSHFQMRGEPVIAKLPVSADPLLVAFTPVGQYLLHAWDWQEERFDSA